MNVSVFSQMDCILNEGGASVTTECDPSLRYGHIDCTLGVEHRGPSYIHLIWLIADSGGGHPNTATTRRAALFEIRPASFQASSVIGINHIMTSSSTAPSPTRSEGRSLVVGAFIAAIMAVAVLIWSSQQGAMDVGLANFLPSFRGTPQLPSNEMSDSSRATTTEEGISTPSMDAPDGRRTDGRAMRGGGGVEWTSAVHVMPSNINLGVPITQVCAVLRASVHGSSSLVHSHATHCHCSQCVVSVHGSIVQRHATRCRCGHCAYSAMSVCRLRNDTLCPFCTAMSFHSPCPRWFKCVHFCTQCQSSLSALFMQNSLFIHFNCRNRNSCMWRGAGTSWSCLRYAQHCRSTL